MRRRIENVLSVRVSSFVATAVSAKPNAAPRTMKLAGCSVEMPGRRITSTPTKPTTMATRRLAVIFSCRIATARMPTHAGPVNSRAKTVASGSSVTPASKRRSRQSARHCARDGAPADGDEAPAAARDGSHRVKAGLRLPPHCGTTGSRRRSRFERSARTATAVAEKERRAPLIHRATAKILRLVTLAQPVREPSLARPPLFGKGAHR